MLSILLGLTRPIIKTSQRQALHPPAGSEMEKLLLLAPDLLCNSTRSNIIPLLQAMFIES